MMSSVPLPWWTSKSTIATRSQAAHVERVARRDRDVVEEAEAHRLVARRVVAGRAHRAERVLRPRRRSPRRSPPPRRRRRAAPPRRCRGRRSCRRRCARGRPLGARPAEHVAQLGDVAALVRAGRGRPRSTSGASRRSSARPGRWRAGGRRSRRAAAGTRGGRDPCRGRGSRGGCRRPSSLVCDRRSAQVTLSATGFRVRWPR